MDLVQEMLKYADYLYKKALSLSGNESDADDLVQDTYLSVLISIRKGVVIENMKSYLLSALKNKYLDTYRKKCSMSKVNIVKIESENDDEYVPGTSLKKDEAAIAIRRELAYLPKIYRETLIQFYLERKSIDTIAANLNISSSAIKNRLDRGRNKIKEGVIGMEPYTSNSFNPEHLKLCVSGILGLNNEPLSVITSKIEQNVLILAYEKPISIKSISKTIGIPTAFIEEIIEKMLKNELMQNVGSRVYTNFPIIDDDFMHNIQEVQSKFVDDYFEAANEVFKSLVCEYKKLNLFVKYNETQLYLCALYSIISGVHTHLMDALNLCKITDYPDRPNDGKWVIDFGHKKIHAEKELYKTFHRSETTFITANSDEVFVNIRYNLKGFSWHVINSTNGQDVGELLYFISKEEKYDHLKTHLIPELTKLELLYYDDKGVLKSNAPIITHTDYEKIKLLNHEYSKRYIDVLGESLTEMVRNNKIIYPKHISSMSFKTHLISIHGISLCYAQYAEKRGVVEVKEDRNYPVVIIVEKVNQSV